METGGGEKRFHAQISWLMFVFSIFVIWVHSYNVDLFSGGAQDSIWILADQIENFVSVGLGQIAVPGFSLLSSYLFLGTFSWDKLPGKWKNRGFSVLVPYVVWNIIYYLGYMAASRLLAMQSVVGRDVIPFTVQEIWRAISRYAYAPIFWYLYQLIFLIIASPVIYYALVKNRAVGLFLDHRACVCGASSSGYAPSEYGRAALLLRCGILCGSPARAGGEKYGGRSHEEPLHGGELARVIISVFCYRRMMTPGADVLWTCFYRMAVPMTCWAFACGIRLPKVRPWMRQSMFLYAIHFVVVRFVNKGAALLTGHVSGTPAAAGIALFIYFLLPAIAVCASYVLAKFLVRFAPGLWRILSGGRKLEG